MMALKPQTYTLHRAPEQFLRATIERDHYLRRWPDPRSLPFGYALHVNGARTAPDGRPWGIVVFKRLQHHRQNGLFGEPGLPTTWQVLDMARVWLHDTLQQVSWPGTDRQGRAVCHTLNLFSRMVSMALRQVQRDWIEFHGVRYPDLPYHIELIVSYCDRQHHQGTGYRAANFTHWGETSDKTKDIYIRRLRRPSWKCVPSLIFEEPSQ